MRKILWILPLVFHLTIINTASAQENTNGLYLFETEDKNMIGTNPFMYFVDSYSLMYTRKISHKDEFSVGLLWSRKSGYFLVDMKIDGKFRYFGYTVGFRRYIAGNMYFEFQLMPAQTNYKSDNGNHFVEGFAVFTEMIYGYKMDFEIEQTNWFINFQLPVGFLAATTYDHITYNDELDSEPVFFMRYPQIYFGIQF